MKITSVEFVKSATNSLHYPEEILPEVAFVGRSNVGKSSLINTLVNRKRLAKTSSTPGRTQLVNFFKVNSKIFFVDLPGYGYAKVPDKIRRNWGTMVEGYLQNSQNLRMVVMILDVRHDPSADDISLINWLRHYAFETLFVLTKIDKLSRNKQQIRFRRFKECLDLEDEKIIPFSARTSQGKELIWEYIGKVVT